MPIKLREEQIIEEFAQFEDWLDKYQYIIEMGETLEPLDEAEKCDTNLIRGCQSQVWIVCENNEGWLTFRADSDAIIVRGIVALLLQIVDSTSYSDILNCDFDFINKIGLMEHLSPTRSNGIVSMIKRIKDFALAVQFKQEGGK